MASFWLEMLYSWGKLWISPVLHPELLWVIIPIYINWLFTDFYQEKKGTSLGNAVTNGAVAVWIGADWSRTTYNLYKAGELAFGSGMIIRAVLAILIIAYGVLVIKEGVQVKKITKYIGRIREESYIALMITPIIYGVVDPSFAVFAAVIMGLPIVYFLAELLLKIIPNPQTYEETDMPDVGGDMPDLGDLSGGLDEKALSDDGGKL